MDLTDNVIQEVQQKEGLIASFLDTLPEKALNLGIRIGLALIFFFIGVELIKLIRKIIRKSMNRAGAETGVIQFVDSFVKASLYIILIHGQNVNTFRPEFLYFSPSSLTSMNRLRTG